MSRTQKPIEYVVNGTCYVCTSHAPGNRGYPVVTRDGKYQHVIRYLYEQAHGRLAAGKVVRHTCDNRMCINVAHAVPGSIGDNIKDRDKRGRTAKGQRHGRAKLTEADVKCIRQSKQSRAELANRFHISVNYVSRIRHKAYWNHL